MKITWKQVIIASIAIGLIVPGYFVLRSNFVDDSQKENFPIGALYSFLVAILIFFFNSPTIRFLKKRFPWHVSNAKRLIFEVLLTNINAAVAIVIMSMIFRWVFMERYAFADINWNEALFTSIIIALIINTIALATMEAVYMFGEWKAALLRAGELEKENIRSQLLSLRQQVDPHFLFNSLNALYSLIEEDAGKAKEFVRKMAAIYRYVLDVREQLVVTLREEVDFVNDYFYLQKIRYGDNIRMQLKLDEKVLGLFIPPLSLQMMIENAIKHNIISAERPLVVEITEQEDYIVVKNKLQRKHEVTASSRLGHENLVRRYSYLSENLPAFFVEQDDYVARLPLLNDE